MQSEWIIWSLVILLASTTYNILNSYAGQPILTDPASASIWARVVLIIAGILSIISLFIPNIGITDNIYTVLSDNMNLVLTIFAGLVLVILFSVFPIALKTAGALAVAIMNLNFVLQLVFNIVFKGVKPSSMEIFGTVAFVLSVMFLIYEKFHSA